MQFPQINLNGTSGETLLQEVMDAMAAVDTALTYLGKMTVHGRDYQTVETPYAALAQAQREHGERMNKLSSVHEELMQIALNLTDQVREREQRRG